MGRVLGPETHVRSGGQHVRAGLPTEPAPCAGFMDNNHRSEEKFAN